KGLAPRKRCEPQPHFEVRRTKTEPPTSKKIGGFARRAVMGCDFFALLRKIKHLWLKIHLLRVKTTLGCGPPSFHLANMWFVL
ncbi:hypothetical protein, partial [Brevundimonas nasdae]|uniref:hypothetical protein n=1 Tax=Brevundimonas nasdae TaxID=172043 RepID=UPI003F691208